ncbi:polyprenyl synthetase family protein [Ferviditalea candida]|uniref:Farnesyl diphosphate synthase n=1 Tax=Ferviditalea candida TaxID=3108399 RepID=A0ABU5ZG05_9BACL|nr:farnesyl diphosphate synthase [Paenibacillaceae bacterium T2]
MNDSLTIEQYIKRQSETIERELRRIIPLDWNIPPKLKESMRYSLEAGGKRMRPILVLAAVEALGGSVEAAMPAACAVEMIHTYSLIHDDLPAMDNDDFRRGKPTNHKVFGEAMAILAGDGLLTHAFHTALQSYRKQGIPAERMLSIIEELAAFAGIAGMVGGQAADILGEQGVTTLKELEYIHLHKTGDLIVCSLRIGGHAALASDEQLEALQQFGRNIGLAFQIQDDILDIVGDEAKLGKKTNADGQANKVTFPYFIGLEASRDKVAELTAKGKQAIQDGNFPNPERLLRLADYLMGREY